MSYVSKVPFTLSELHLETLQSDIFFPFLVNIVIITQEPHNQMSDACKSSCIV